MIEKEIKVQKLDKGYLVESEGSKFAFPDMREVVNQIVEILGKEDYYDEISIKVAFIVKKTSDES